MPKILLLENDKWFAESLKATLQADFEVKICRSPEKVFAILDKWRPDLMLADAVLGEKNLFMLLNEMQSYVDTREIKTIILSVSAPRIDPRDVVIFNVKKVLDKATVELGELKKEILRCVE
ncbi:MAG: hypothetical protein LBM09_00465 [Candidatus Nomurabacteria bacterium]|jgi:DNA-binding response OmpR family regulator|nr:hypothetical protein [Candidatus Nomurabacteria bacterium]